MKFAIYFLVALGCWLGLIEVEDTPFSSPVCILIALVWPLGLGYLVGLNLNDTDDEPAECEQNAGQ